MDAKTKRVFKFIFITLLVDLIAFSLILPLLPKILDYYAIHDDSKAYEVFDRNVKYLQNLLNVPESHNQVLLAGLLGSWFSLLQFVSSPFLGAMSDKFGRKPILILSMGGTFLSYIVWMLASNNFSLFILSRTIGGLCKANVSLSLAIVSDVSDEKSRGKGMAIVGSSFSLAFIIGPLLGAYLTTTVKSDESQSQLIRNPSIIATFLSLINLLIVAGFLPETCPKRKIQAHHNKNHDGTISKAFQYINPKSLFNFTLVDQRNLKEKSILKQTGFIYFYYLLLYSGLEFTLSFLTHIRFGFSSMDQGKLYLFSGIIMVTVQGGYIRRMKSGREALMVLVGLSTIIPSFIMMGIASSVGQIYCSLILYSFSSAVVVPCLTTLVSSNCPLNSRGALMGTFRSIGSLSRALGPCIASLFFWSLGPTICYVGGAVALTLPLLIMSRLYNTFKMSAKHDGTATKTTTFRESAKAS